MDAIDQGVDAVMCLIDRHRGLWWQAEREHIRQQVAAILIAVGNLHAEAPETWADAEATLRRIAIEDI